MEALDLFGYAGSILIGISLGLIGGGGSILTVPVLVYLFRIDAVLATAYSLFIVGLSALEGSGTYYRQGLVSIRTALVFGAPALVPVVFHRQHRGDEKPATTGAVCGIDDPGEHQHDPRT